VGEEVRLFTHLYLREETIGLYGFESENELAFFKKLNAIPGIGPRSAIGILSAAKMADLKRAILNENYETLTKVSGIGRKTAERIIIELKDKLEKDSIAQSGSGDVEVIEALVKLGYPIKDARAAIRKIANDIEGSRARLREALRLISK
jgi:Holliday junction DNA helicase RuvA